MHGHRPSSIMQVRVVPESIHTPSPSHWKFLGGWGGGEVGVLKAKLLEENCEAKPGKFPGGVRGCKIKTSGGIWIFGGGEYGYFLIFSGRTQSASLTTQVSANFNSNLSDKHTVATQLASSTR